MRSGLRVLHAWCTEQTHTVF